MRKDADYNIGLDIGVASVGWCVTNDENNILKRNGKNMWGSRLFSEASTAKNTRMLRSSRRRLERRKNRILYLQQIFQDDMEKEYPNFFPMLKETANIPEDKRITKLLDGKKYNLFSEQNFTDVQYYNQFKTIYHLRKYLIESNKKADLRLVYLALHHIIKYRGNFLYEGDFNNQVDEIENDILIVNNFVKENYFINSKIEEKEIINILKDKTKTKAEKKEILIKVFEFDSASKPVITNIVKAIIGYNFDVSKIFEIDYEKGNISFAKEIENEEEIEELLGNQVEIYEAMKNIYSWFTLQDILKGNKYISDAFIEKYDKYKGDLILLKNIYKKYYSNEYKSFFKEENINNYVHYNGKQIRKLDKSCDNNEFFKKVSQKIKSLPEDYEKLYDEVNKKVKIENEKNGSNIELDDRYRDKENILQDIESGNFICKLNVTDNGAIPHQLHEIELKKIIENQKQYYEFLNENAEKIIKIFETRIPYYVGPLIEGKKGSRWSWLIKNNEQEKAHIRPWNMEETINKNETAEKFINELTNYCTYLQDEKVMPKQSILYSKYCVLNELNNIRINGKHIAKDFKQKIINEYFERKTKVTKKDIISFYDKEGINVSSFEGLSDVNNFNSNMKSYKDMIEILGKVDDSNIEMCEKIIYYVTIFEDKKILREKIKNEYSGINDEQLRRIMKLKYSGWSRLSRKFLTGIKSYNNETIMDRLMNTHENLMQIINNKELGFDKIIENNIPKKSGRITYEDVDEIQTSPANKRAIWQTICVVNEIKKIMKKEPKNIYIEFARSEDRNKRLKDSRLKNLLKIYEDIKEQIDEIKKFDPDVYKELKKHQDDKDVTEKMYLYFIQNGKCLYSGEKLDIDELDKYEVDHIIPRSYIKDDSIDNKALVKRRENQRKKDSLLLTEDVIRKNISWWKNLYDNNLISAKKYHNLTRRKMFETESEKNKFVQRQLVETRQITKYVTNLLKDGEENVEIYALRAELTHWFREKYEIYKNRNVNNCHHAQDAYIISTIGNIISKEWPKKEDFQYGQYVDNYLREAKAKNEKYGMVIGFISKRVEISKIKQAMNYKDYFISRMLEEQTGEFYNQTIQKAGQGKIKLKPNKDTNRYGGYTNENEAYSVIYKYIDKSGKQQYKMIGIPIRIASDIKRKRTNLQEYITDVDFNNNDNIELQIIRNKIMKNQIYLDQNDEPLMLCSSKEIRPAKELILNEEMSKLVYMMNSSENKLTDEEKEEVKRSYSKMYDYLMSKLEKEYKIHKNSYMRLINKKEEFETLEDEDKKKAINGIIDLMFKGQGNLKVLGMSDREGRMSGKTFKTDKLIHMTFVDKSVTGMYERRQKINGMENNSSK